jgi:hypothetical protein
MKFNPDYTKQIKEKQNRIQEIFEEFSLPDLSTYLPNKKEVEQAIARLETEGRKLAEAGWTIPRHLTPGELSDILDTNDIEVLDNIFFEYYTKDENTNLNEVFEELLSDTRLKQWDTLLCECVSAYKLRHYSITIPSLILILEGILATMLTGKQKRNINMREVTKSKLDALSTGSFHRIFWISINYFVECLYKTSFFDEDRPLFINRNWIMHGRDSTEWKQVDSIRLFIAINTLQTVVFNDFKG